uniref:Uncharacterized protein n=1 Tax=Helianthus annuus TaxID=4232 RepID=A0A251TT79_HELAN
MRSGKLRCYVRLLRVFAHLKKLERESSTRFRTPYVFFAIEGYSKSIRKRVHKWYQSGRSVARIKDTRFHQNRSLIASNFIIFSVSTHLHVLHLKSHIYKNLTVKKRLKF